MPDDLLEKRSGHTQSVSRALSLLMKLSEEPEGLNLSELARRVKLAPSTAHRLLTTLQLDQFVRFEDSRWLIGVRSFDVGSSYLRARDICYMARPYLRFLMQETGETSTFQDFKTSRFQDFKISGFQDFKIQDFKISRSQDFKISRFQDLKASEFQDFKILVDVRHFEDFKI